MENTYQVTKTPKVGIVLVGYNDEKYIVDCINSLLAQTYQNFEILYWDNASTDSSVEVLQNNFPTIDYVQSENNLGFAKANNLAVKQLLRKGAEYILFLNVDTVADSQMIEKLVDKADENTVTTARIYMDAHRRKVWYAGGELLLKEGNARHLQLSNTQDAQEVSFISGCCMMIHRNIIKKYGLFEHKYYLYYEDTDLCMRWFLNGVKMYYVPTAILWHKVGGSLGGGSNPIKEYYMTRNRLYFAKRYQRYSNLKLMPIIFRLLGVKVSDFIKTGNWDMLYAVGLGIRDFLIGRIGKRNVYLELDKKYGVAYLNAVRKVIKGIEWEREPRK